MNLINNVVVSWWHWMSAMLWQVSLLVLLVSVLDYLFKDRLWPQVRYALWLLVLLKLVLPPSLSLPTSPVSHLKPKVEQRFTATFARPLPEELQQGESAPVREVQEAPPIDTAEPAPSSESTAPIEKQTVLDWRVVAFGIWLAGIVLFSVLLLLKMRRLRKWHDEQKEKELPPWFHNLLVETASYFNLNRLPAIVFSPHAKTPAVYGIVNPVMLLPAHYFENLSEEEAKHVLLHELAHLKRGDLIMHAVALGLQIIYWFNPLLVWVNRQLKHVREICCDLTVANVLREHTKAYRQTLLNTAREMLTERLEPGLGLLGVFEDPFRLVSRLRWLEKETWETRKLMAAAAVGVVLIAVSSLLPMASLAPKTRTVDNSNWAEKSLDDQSLVVNFKTTEKIYAVVLPQRGDPNINFPNALEQCRKLMAEQDIKSIGPVFARFYSDPKDTPQQEQIWEVGFPVKKGTRIKFPLDFRVFRDRKVASTKVIGLKNTAEAWISFVEKIESMGMVAVFPTADEIYHSKPDEPMWWNTELQIEVLDPQSGSMSIQYETSEPIYAAALPVYGSFWLNIEKSKKELDNYLKQQHIKPTGPLFAQFYSSPGEVTSLEYLWELAYPVTAGVEVQEPFKILQLPAQEIARTTLPGSMELENPWSALIVQMVLNGKVPVGAPTEMYFEQKRNPSVEMRIPVMDMQAEAETWQEWGESFGQSMVESAQAMADKVKQYKEQELSSSGDGDLERLRQRLADIGEKMREAYRQGDYDRALQYWDKDVVLNNNYEPETYGRSALLRQWQRNERAGVRILTYNTDDVAIERCGKQIVAAGTYAVSYRLKNEPNPQHEYGKYLTIWEEKPDGSLVITYSMTNTDYVERGES